MGETLAEAAEVAGLDADLETDVVVAVTAFDDVGVAVEETDGGAIPDGYAEFDEVLPAGQAAGNEVDEIVEPLPRPGRNDGGVGPGARRSLATLTQSRHRACHACCRR